MIFFSSGLRHIDLSDQHRNSLWKDFLRYFPKKMWNKLESINLSRN